MKRIAPSVLAGVALEAALVGAILWVHDRLGIRPLPLHPLTLLSLASQFPGIILGFFIMFVSVGASNAELWEVIMIGATIIGQAAFFGLMHFKFWRR